MKSPHRILLVGGFPSSGTDLVKNILNAHSDVHLTGELPLLPSLAGRYGATLSESGAAEAAWADLDRIDVYGNLDPNARLPDGTGPVHFADLFASKLKVPAAQWVGNKTPQNSQHIPSLLQLFPDAHFITVVRDVRDVALSWRRKWNKDPLLCAAKWNDRMLECVGQAEKLAPSRHLLLRYEDVLGDPEGSVYRMCRFLGLPFEEAMLNHSRHVSSVPDGKKNYGAPLDRSNAGKWRSARDELDVPRIEEAAWPGLQRFGYPIECAKGPRPITRMERLAGKAVDVASMLATGNRYARRGLSYRVRAIGLELRKLYLYRLRRDRARAAGSKADR